jgi:hypothetical protein
MGVEIIATAIVDSYLLSSRQIETYWFTVCEWLELWNGLDI